MNTDKVIVLAVKMIIDRSNRNSWRDTKNVYLLFLFFFVLRTTFYSHISSGVSPSLRLGICAEMARCWTALACMSFPGNCLDERWFNSKPVRPSRVMLWILHKAFRDQGSKNEKRRQLAVYRRHFIYLFICLHNLSYFSFTLFDLSGFFSRLK